MVTKQTQKINAICKNKIHTYAKALLCHKNLQTFCVAFFIKPIISYEFINAAKSLYNSVTNISFLKDICIQTSLLAYFVFTNLLALLNPKPYSTILSA
jgi:hypothetical protein